MNYSLGNMLGGAGALNADKLALNLQFATDKTLTARKGPTPVFTRASTATFIGSNGLIQSAAINAARFDHDPITLACKGLLIEESRTNLCFRSADVSTWSGTFSNSGSTTAPDGTSAGYLAGIGTGNCQTPITTSVTGLYTLSVYLKRNNTDWVRLQAVQGANVNFVNFWVNLATGTAGTLAIGAGTPTSLSAQVTPAGNGWYRCSVTASYPATNYLNISIVSATADNSTTRVAGSIYGVWGAQIEAGAFPTSYIPTTTASVVRSADICSITGSDFTGFYNQSEGTFLTQSTKTSTNSNAFIIHASDNSFVNGIDLRYATITSAQAVINVSSSGQVAAFTATVTSGSLVKQSMAYKLNDCAYSVNGASAITDTSALIPTVNRINFGTAYTGLPLNGHIASVRFYKKRLANAKLVTLTA
jgi:hypothetical protein